MDATALVQDVQTRAFHWEIVAGDGKPRESCPVTCSAFAVVAVAPRPGTKTVAAVPVQSADT